ncbi:hypothetical protein [Neobacillus fumarioli]|uniref:hypothetical protein n=1 Tax=Neobacillus fumarioli TaxID=105229 RepID=UPI000831556E|nr:hypothetical protein [Neobacillus fumarioli]
MKLSLENISITKMETSAGMFIGKTNTLKQFQNQKEVNEVIGTISGRENKLTHNYWMKNKMKEG